jgi:hypothetical protein
VRLRRLKFDLLEERRLLAGLQVVVFDDVDGTRVREASEPGLSGKAVFVDLNSDGNYGVSEPWAITNEQGVASFPTLAPGNYAVRLIGSNSSVVQTWPTRPSSEVETVDGIDKVIRVESDGSFWAIQGDVLSRIGQSRQGQPESIEFGERQILDAVFAENETGDGLHGYALTESSDHVRELWKLSRDTQLGASLIPVNANRFSQLSLSGDLLFAQAVDGVNDLIRVEAESTLDVRPISFPDMHAQEVQTAGTNRFVTLDMTGGASRLTVYEDTGTQTQVLGRRVFASAVQEWSVAPDGKSIAVNTVDDFLILDIKPGLPSRTVLENASQPIVFDLARNQLITGSKSDETMLVGWDMTQWKSVLNFPTQAIGKPQGDIELHLDAYGRYLVGSVNGQAYRHDLAQATASEVEVTSQQLASTQIGIRMIRDNEAPEFPLESLYVNEDGSLPIRWNQNGAFDADGDDLVYLIHNMPVLGTLNWNQNGSGLYVPEPNAFGTEILQVQAYDGFQLSPLQTLALHVLPVNDVPTRISASVNMIDENPIARTALATINVDDPDLDSDYEYILGDSRFEIENGFLYFVSGVLSFEKEPTLLLPITASNRSTPTDRITKTLTLNVADKNDPPTSIRVPSLLSIPELLPGAALTTVQVMDEDSSSNYTYEVSDARFEVVGGVLRLRDDVSLDFETDTRLALTIIATDIENQESIATTVTISVSDLNDPPVDLFFSCIAEVEEGESGVAVGYAEVIDPDAGETYTFNINDDRFQIVQGIVSLKPGVRLSYSNPGYLDLVVTATSNRSGEQLAKSARLHVTRDRTPHHNDVNPYDVDGDGKVTPLDPLIIINHINDHGVGPLDSFGEGEGNMPDLDVDGDGAVSPIDILILINELNDINAADAESDDDADQGDESGDTIDVEPEAVDPKNISALRTNYVDQMFAGALQQIETELAMFRRSRLR